MANGSVWLPPHSRRWPDTRRHILRDLARASSSPQRHQSRSLLFIHVPDPTPLAIACSMAAGGAETGQVP